MRSPTLSVILITKNESAHIDACLASVAFADEWIVVDAQSSDETAERARRFGATVLTTADWPGFGPQKQRALDRASGEWVLAIDADERVTPQLAASIRAVIGSAAVANNADNADNANAQSAAAGSGAADARPYAAAPARQGDSAPVTYELSRLSRFGGRWVHHGDWHPDRVLRLFRREAGRFSSDRVHERVLVTGAVGRLNGNLLHHTMPSLDDALAKLNRYSSAGAAAKVAGGQRGGLGRALVHGTWAFLRSYIVRRGFLDGAVGFIVALYVAEGTYWRYLKIAELARGLPAGGDAH